MSTTCIRTADAAETSARIHARTGLKRAWSGRWMPVAASMLLLQAAPAAVLASTPAAAPAPDTSAADQATAALRAILPQDLSPWGMFLTADPVVKAVMIGLVFASIATWTIWLSKSIELFVTRRRARALNVMLCDAENLDEARQRTSVSPYPMSRLVEAAIAEIALSNELPVEGVKERIISRLERLEVAAGRQISRGTGVLATIGATAPFVGLFGTVWGIMHSFIGISQAHTSSLAVVAPGIAEALLATAFGLFAAIPAVVIYNGFSRAIAAYRALLGDVSAAAMRLASRDLDRRRHCPPVRG